MLPRSFREMKNHPVRSRVSGSGPAEFFLHGWGRINLRRSYWEGEVGAVTRIFLLGRDEFREQEKMRGGDVVI